MEFQTSIPVFSVDTPVVAMPSMEHVCNYSGAMQIWHQKHVARHNFFDREQCALKWAEILERIPMTSVLQHLRVIVSVLTILSHPQFRLSSIFNRRFRMVLRIQRAWRQFTSCRREIFSTIVKEWERREAAARKAAVRSLHDRSSNRRASVSEYSDFLHSYFSEETKLSAIMLLWLKHLAQWRQRFRTWLKKCKEVDNAIGSIRKKKREIEKSGGYKFHLLRDALQPRLRFGLTQCDWPFLLRLAFETKTEVAEPRSNLIRRGSAARYDLPEITSEIKINVLQSPTTFRIRKPSVAVKVSAAGTLNPMKSSLALPGLMKATSEIYEEFNESNQLSRNVSSYVSSRIASPPPMGRQPTWMGSSDFSNPNFPQFKQDALFPPLKSKGENSDFADKLLQAQKKIRLDLPSIPVHQFMQLFCVLEEHNADRKQTRKKPLQLSEFVNMPVRELIRSSGHSFFGN